MNGNGNGLANGNDHKHDPFGDDMQPLENVVRALRRSLRLNQLRDPLGIGVTREAREWVRKVDEDGLPQDPAAREQLRNELTRLCTQGQVQLILATNGFPSPSYNIFQPFDENTYGPWGALLLPFMFLTPPVWTVLGRKVAYPIGVPASVLTATAAWIEFYARYGFNVLTYKTVRSRRHIAHLSPNWIFLKGPNQPVFPDVRFPDSVGDVGVWPADPQSFSMANSFGVPSPDPNEWKADLETALGCLRDDQLLITSVMGSQEELDGEDLIRDFILVAKDAEDAGAPVIELNISCPNTVVKANREVLKTLICEQTDFAIHLSRQVRKELHPDTKLVIKLGYMSRHKLEALVKPLILKHDIDGVSGINTVQANVRKEGGSPAFQGTPDDPTADRTIAGISGVAIREYGLRFTQYLNDIRRELQERDGVTFDILSMGGVMTVDDVETLLSTGAQAVQTATASFFDPAFAHLVQRHWLETELGMRSRQVTMSDGAAMPLRDLSDKVSRQVEAHLQEVERESKRSLVDIGAQAWYQDGSWHLHRVSVLERGFPAKESDLASAGRQRDDLAPLTSNGYSEVPQDSINLGHVIKALQEILPLPAVAYLAGQGNSVIEELINTRREDVDPHTEEKLYAAYEILLLLLKKKRRETVQAWFFASNPYLEAVPPIEALHRGNLAEVRLAARDFANGIYR
jgi:dihydroorotate dehydrogenase